MSSVPAHKPPPPFVGPMPCPECAVKKCGNCDGATWDNQLDAEIPCPCASAGHPGA